MSGNFGNFIKKVMKLFSTNVTTATKGDDLPIIKGDNINVTTTKGDDSPIINGNNNVYKK
jgi:hypothetical protein